MLLVPGLVVGACRDEAKDPATPTPTAAASPSPAATQAPPLTPTVDPLASTAADGARALETVRKLSVEIGPRVSGTAAEMAARDYLMGELASYGYAVSAQEFAFDASQFLPVSVDIGGEAVLGLGLTGTATGMARGPLVLAGIGRAEDFPAGGAAGAIALIERGDLTFREKVQNALAAGAAGVIIYNNDEGQVLGDLDGDVQIPAAGIKQADGDALAARLAAGEQVEATITVTGSQATSFNVIAKPQDAAVCDTVTGGHYDSVPVTGGANDNSSGTAAVLETARITAARKTPGAHCFVLFGAEEFGLFGSREFVTRLPDAELNALRGMVNLDVVGLPQDLELIGSEDLVRQAGVIADGLGLPARQSFLASGLGSDHASFINAGVPAVFLYRHDTLIHTPEDAIGRMSPDSLAQAAEVAAAIIAEMGE